jgi:integrating conjugative element protein (TIGR03758 family)
MNSTQREAFLAASGQPSDGLLLAIGSILAMFALVWLAWLALKLFDQWTRRRVDLAGVVWYVLRGAVVLSVVAWLAW